jgi:hypothetical protein
VSDPTAPQASVATLGTSALALAAAMLAGLTLEN